jgi:serine/threonine protein kinase
MMKWLCQLLLALDYLQTMKVLHRDIKTSNLLLTCDMDVQLGATAATGLLARVAAAAQGTARTPLSCKVLFMPSAGLAVGMLNVVIRVSYITFLLSVCR